MAGKLLSDIFTYSEDNPLLFTSLYFWIFFFVLLLIYSVIYKKRGVRNGYLFLMSLFFYYKSGGFFFSLLIFSTIADYILGRLIYSSSTLFRRRFFLSLSLFLNLGLLAFFKYSYFLTDLVNQVAGTDFEVFNFMAEWYNMFANGSLDTSVIVLPVGISFYTFQTMSYTFDIYRGKLKPVRNIIDFGFYVSFFPQLVAGPIVRASEFVPQLYSSFKLTVREMGHAIFLICTGLFKKMVISDYISVNFVDRVFDSPISYTGFENLMAVYGYSVQIFCDFSGYTDIAIGLALLLGFRLPVNFNSPYKAVNVTDFWRRWHISLSSWLRDYLYISLGGNRKGKIRAVVNIMITMLLGGLWHGASIRFIIWGGLHGAALVFHKLWLKVFHSGKYGERKASMFGHFLSLFITFQFVSFTWIFFRSGSMNSAFDMLSQIAYSFNGFQIPGIVSAHLMVFSLIVFAMIVHWLPARYTENVRGIFIRSPLFLKMIVLVLLVFIVYQFKSAAIQPFIYFQF